MVLYESLLMLGYFLNHYRKSHFGDCLELKRQFSDIFTVIKCDIYTDI